MCVYDIVHVQVEEIMNVLCVLELIVRKEANA